jgi:uncharacterized iron-regulated protein
MDGKKILAALPLVLVTALPARAQDPSHDDIDTAYVAGEYRVFTGAGEPATIDDIVAEMGRHQVVFIGESHDDPTGHKLELELLQRAHETYGTAGSSDDASRALALSLEFFQRDVQLILDEYLAGLITEKAFQADSRPWPRYGPDYRPLIEFAKQNGLTAIAANAPRRYVTRVTMNGRESLGDLSPEALASLAPLPYGQPSQEYRDQWIQVISEVMAEEGMKCGLPIPEPEEGEEAEQPRAPVGSHGMMGNQLDSQVLWDATMAYSVAGFLMEEPDALVLHMVGGFHVARGTGTPEHLKKYRPGTPYMIVLLRPVKDIDSFEPAPAGEWGDFVVQTDESRTLEQIECRKYLSDLETK